ncbi:hypothetical protein CkaCkLH20_11798 [Colletotrichum karsti]|uniref:Uncharacterized protein n=1 Tax=Colletotrichum karsti TaxID=1095194 RepID=A0A9P6HYI6_9PEZI|nr:uncharacterized protein CkaCkLH20_11798 [Colletotrichum karsti]KAF9870696.1 hypothetical protein CkaCkLH20_11798 [Colletotrichum karsti]
MVDRLLSAPPETIPKIRRLRVVGDPLQLARYSEEDYAEGGVFESHPSSVFYQLPSVLKILPGLKLDTLTVLGPRSPAISYCTLTGLITESDGWRELRFITHSSSLLGFNRPFATDMVHPHSRQLQGHTYMVFPNDWEYVADYYTRRPQPITWRAMLRLRDGESTNPEVDVYRSVIAESPGSVTDPSKRVRFEQEDQPAVIFPEGFIEAYGGDVNDVPEQVLDSLPGFGRRSDKDLVGEGEKRKEMMVVVRRGTGVDYEEKKDSPFIDSDIRRDCGGKSWEQIRRERVEEPAANLHRYRRSMYQNNYGYKDSGARDVAEPVVGSEVDAYDDAEGIVWPPRHFDAPPRMRPWQIDELGPDPVGFNPPSLEKDEKW